MRRFFAIVVALSSAAVLLFPGPGGLAFAKGLVSGSYTLSWSQDVQNQATYKDSRTFKQTLETKYSGFLSPLVENEISLKIDYDKSPDAATKVSVYPTITLAYKGSYWNAGTKRTVTREPGSNQKVSDSHFVEVFYQPVRFGMPDFKGKYTADFDAQSGTTDKFKQGVTLSTNYQPAEWFTLKGDYAWTADDERFRKDPPDPTLTPVTKEEKYSITAGVRHFISQNLKINTEWKSEFSRSSTFFDNGVTKLDSNKEDQDHTWKNTLAFRPFADTSIDGTFDFDLKQTMLPKIEAGQVAQEEHTITYNSSVKAVQKVGKPIELRGEYTRARTDVRHNLSPNVNNDDGWSIEAKGDFSKQLQLDAKYTLHNIVAANPGDISKVPNRTGNVIKSASWTGDLLPIWKPAATYDLTDSYDFTVQRGKYLKTSETKYGLKGPVEFKYVDLSLTPTYDITIKNDYSNVDPAAQETITTRDFKLRVAKTLLLTRTIEFKVDHTYGRKAEYGHVDPLLNNINRSDTSSANLQIKDIVPNYVGGLDITRSATDTSGDADLPDVTENFNLKIDYKFEKFGWNASFKYDRNLRFDKFNKWTFDWKASWTVSNWDLSLTYNQSKTLSLLLDESYRVGIDFKYNF
jgi:hypothetical protein